MSYQDYYFKTESDVLFVNEDTQRVGILNSNPTYTLDVDGTINTSNILAINAVCDYIEGSNAIITTIEGDNAIIDNVLSINVSALSNVSSSNLISQSNLKLFNAWISDECPKPNRGSLFGFSLGGGVIDPSWLKVDNDWETALGSLWNAAQTGYDLFTLARSIFDENNKIAEPLKDALDEALNDGQTLRVDWGNLNNKPIYADKTTKDVGMSGDVYFNEAKTLYSLNSAYFTSVGDNGNLHLSSTQGRQQWLNIGSLELFMKQITSSNITSSNLTASNVYINSNLDAPRITVNDTLRVGNYYITQNGIYVGNPAFPLTSQLVIDAQGNYKGTIDRNQIVNLEAFNISALADGQLVFGSFGDTNILNDPFANLTALYNVG